MEAWTGVNNKDILWVQWDLNSFYPSALIYYVFGMHVRVKTERVECLQGNN